jgi:ribosomal protein L37AE/L43A
MTKLRDLWNDEGYLLKKDGDNEVRISAPGMAVAGMETQCPSCAKLIGDHTPEEIWNCPTPKKN